MKSSQLIDLGKLYMKVRENNLLLFMCRTTAACGTYLPTLKTVTIAST